MTSDDTDLRAHTFTTKATYLIALGRYDEARSIAREALTTSLRSQQPACVAFALDNLANIAVLSRDPGRGDSIDADGWCSFAFNVRNNRSVELADDCGFEAFSWCNTYPGSGHSTLTILRPPRLPGGISSTPEVVTLRDRNRVVRIRGSLPDEFLPLTFPKAGRVLIFHAPEIGADEWVDGMPLSVLDFNHGQRPLHIRVRGTRTWATLSPDGDSLIATVGGFREAFQRKTLVRCDLAKAACRPWHHLARFVELDPVWSPDGTRVAFIRARDVTEAQLTSNMGTLPEPWAEGRRLVVTSAAEEPKAAPFATTVDRVESPAWIGST